MPKVSRIAPDQNQMGLFIDNFWNAITLVENKAEAKALLKDLLTHTEIKMFAKRVQIAKMLIQGHNYQAIKTKVKVTSGTVAHVNNLLNTRGEGLRQIVHRLLKIETEIQKKREGQKQIIPPGPYRLLPDLVELSAAKAKETLKKNSKRKSALVEEKNY